jgi:hypothetical protein
MVSVPTTENVLVFGGSFNDGSTNNELWAYFSSMSVALYYLIEQKTKLGCN